MPAFVDDILAFRVLYLLVTPFEQTDAFRLGIIDKNGNNLKKSKDLKTGEEKSAYTNLHKLVFNMKKILEKVPVVGKSQLSSLAAAYWLIKEAIENKTSLNEARCIDILSKDICFIEEEILIESFLNEDGAIVGGVDSGSIPNVTGHSVSTDEPVITRTVPHSPMFRRLKSKISKKKYV